MGEEGWTFESAEGVIQDLFGARALHEVYTRADARYTGRVSVPVLWDTGGGHDRQQRIRRHHPHVQHRLSIDCGAALGDYYPADKRGEIDALNDRIYATVNNGVYRAGFAKTQDAYDAAIADLFGTLDWLEARLTSQPYLTGNCGMTEADWRLFTTLIRFDAVYHGHFKCNMHSPGGLPGAAGLYPHALSGSGRRGDGESRPHQAPLLSQPSLA